MPTRRGARRGVSLVRCAASEHFERNLWAPAREFRDTEPRCRIPDIDVPGLASANAAERLQAIHDLEKSVTDYFSAIALPASPLLDVRLITGVVLASRLFADPDPEVAKAARESAAGQLKPWLERRKKERGLDAPPMSPPRMSCGPPSER